jgi:hypothetical protein
LSIEPALVWQTDPLEWCLSIGRSHIPRRRVGSQRIVASSVSL